MSDNIIQLNEDLIKHDLKDLVRSSVEETLNALLDHEADELVNASKYERTENRNGYRSGHYERNFTTTAGDVKLKVPKLKGIQFETAIIERYKRRECSVEEALIEMGIEYHRIRIATPRHNGKVERQHRTDELRFYKHMRMFSLEDGRKQLAVYQRESNNHIMTCLGMRSPNQVLELYHGVMW